MLQSGQNITDRAYWHSWQEPAVLQDLSDTIKHQLPPHDAAPNTSLNTASPVREHHQGEKITSNQTWTQKFCCLVGPCGTHQSCYQKLTFHSPATLLATQSDTSCEQYHNDLSKPIVVPGPCVLQRMLSSRF